LDGWTVGREGGGSTSSGLWSLVAGRWSLIAGLWSLASGRSCDRVGWRRVWPVKCATSGRSGGEQAGASDYHRAGSTQHRAMQSWTGMPPVDRLDEVGPWESSQACTGLHRAAQACKAESRARSRDSGPRLLSSCQQSPGRAALGPITRRPSPQVAAPRGS
jgi:hypothetical protein